MASILFSDDETGTFIDLNDPDDTTATNYRELREGKLAKLNGLVNLLQNQHPDGHPNLEPAIRMINCLRFIAANLDTDGYIFYLVKHQINPKAYQHYGLPNTPLESFKPEFDAGKGVLRDFQGVSFHIQQASEPEALAVAAADTERQLAERIAIMEQAYEYLFSIQGQRPDVITHFLNKIVASEKGCLDERFGAALKYLEHIQSGKIPKLEDLFEEIERQVSTDVAPPLEQLLKLIHKFKTHMGITVTSCFKEGEEITLTLNSLREFCIALGTTYDKDLWDQLIADLNHQASLPHPSFVDQSGQNFFYITHCSQKVAEATLELIKHLLPQESSNLARARVSIFRPGLFQTRQLSYQFLLTPIQLAMLASLPAKWPEPQAAQTSPGFFQAPTIATGDGSSITPIVLN